MDPAELFSKAPTEKKEANPKLNMVKFLQVRFPRGRMSKLSMIKIEFLVESSVTMALQLWGQG